MKDMLPSVTCAAGMSRCSAAEPITMVVQPEGDRRRVLGSWEHGRAVCPGVGLPVRARLPWSLAAVSLHWKG